MSSNFKLSDYISLFDELRNSGVVFETLETPNLLSASANKVHYLKHDIHHDLASTLRLAQAQNECNICASYFMMPKSKVNEKYYGKDETWKILREIQSLGHVIGLHVDGFEIIENYGDLKVGIDEIKKEFQLHGVNITIANTHGNSRYQKKFNFETVNFYKEIVRATECKDEFWMSHYNKYSIEDLGFRVWCDTAIWTKETGNFRLDYFVSDNNMSLRATEMSSSSWSVEGEKFNLKAAHRKKIVDLVSKGSAIYLIHPQFI